MPSSGTCEGLIIGWHNSLNKGKATHVGNFCLSVEFTNFVDNLVWECTTVHGPNLWHLKHEFQEEIRKWHTQLTWAIGGDFNVIFVFEDKIGVSLL